MTRKHFEELAAIMRRHLEATQNPLERTVIASISRQVAAVCADTNRQFNKPKFFAACGLVGNGFLPEYQDIA